MHEPQTDEQLMARVQADEPDAFGSLYDRHSVRALLVARSVTHCATRAEDAVQEAFLSVWRGRASYRPEAGAFKAWAMRIVRNHAVDSVRYDTAGHRPRAAGERKTLDPPAPGNGLAKDAIARSEGEALRDSLRRLPEAQAEIIGLAYFGELTHSEIAKELSLPEGTVKGRMRLGLKKLRDEMSACG